MAPVRMVLMKGDTTTMAEDAAKERSMQIEGLDHLVLTVGDVGRTRDFYERVLGMETVVFGEGRHALAFGAQKINLHEAGREFEPKAAVPIPGSADLCFLTNTPMAEVVEHLDVCCVDWSRDRKGAIIVSPHQGAKDGPAQPYPTPPPDGRGPDRPVLPPGGRLRPSQSPSWALPIPKAARRLGSHRPRRLPATAGNREPTLVLARRREVLFSPVPRCGGVAPFLVPSKGEEAQALPGAPAAGDPLRDGRGAGDLACRLDAAFGFASQAGTAGVGVPRSRMGSLGFLQLLRRKAASALRRQPDPRFLRTHPRQRRGRLPDRGAPRRGGFGGGGSEEPLGRPGLPERGVEGSLGRNGHRSCYRALRAAPRSEATRRDCLVEPQEGVRTGRDACDHAGGACHEDRGQDDGLHSRFSRKPGVGSSSRQIKDLWA